MTRERKKTRTPTMSSGTEVTRRQIHEGQSEGPAVQTWLREPRTPNAAARGTGRRRGGRSRKTALGMTKRDDRRRKRRRKRASLLGVTSPRETVSPRRVSSPSLSERSPRPRPHPAPRRPTRAQRQRWRLSVRQVRGRSSGVQAARPLSAAL